MAGNVRWIRGRPTLLGCGRRARRLPRAGNDLTVHIDGSKAITRITQAICEAKHHVHIASWWLTPSMAVAVNGDAEPLAVRELLARCADKVPVRVLQWAGIPLPGTPMSRAVVNRFMHELADGTAIRWRVDGHERPMHCHHEKLVIVDDEVAFVGGIDLTTFKGDRRDSSNHPDRGTLGWHDVAVEVRGPLVADVARHFAMRWTEVGERDSRAMPDEPLQTGPFHRAVPVNQHTTSGHMTGTGVTAQLVRTLPENVYRSVPNGDFRILESYLRALRSARQFVYLENQFLWSPEIVEELSRLLRHPPTTNFRMLVVLPSKAQGGEDDTRGQLGVLLEADNGNGRLLAVGLHARQTGAASERPPCAVYVHAKVGIVDDRWLTIGSANLNDHSLFNDGEINVVTHDEELVRDTRLRLWAEHLETPINELRTIEPWRVIDQQSRTSRERTACATGRRQATHTPLGRTQ